MKREYKIEKLAFEYPLSGIIKPEQILNNLGEEGWEAVAMLRDPEPRDPDDHEDTLVLFKRPTSK